MIAPILAAAFVCVVTGVHDGDSFRCRDGQRVRSWGVDAPELATSAGPASQQALAKLIAGKSLQCMPMGKSYDRTVARCFLPSPDGLYLGLDVAAEMVRQGQAVDWPRYSHGAYAR